VRRSYRTFFWPAVLVLAGVIALLVNTGALSSDRLAALFDLWPLILIVVGLEIIIRSTMRSTAAEVAAGLVVLLAVVGALTYVVEAPNLPAAAVNQTLDSSESAGSLTTASLEVDAGGATITLTGDSSIGGDLYRAHIQYSGQKPRITLSNGALRISQDNSGFNFVRSNHFVMNLSLNPSVMWDMTENTGASNESLDFSTIKLQSLTINTGASREDIKLGPPSGGVSITVNGGALTVHLHRPDGTPTSVDVSGGAISLNADGHQQHAIGSASYQSGSGDAKDNYDVTINGGACTVTLDTSS
jgi:Domain of unknown function (DUF5668)